jgi:hypothetical protein
MGPWLVRVLTIAAGVVAATLALQDHEGHGQVLGDVRFATSCSAPAHAEVGRGVALLHSFWLEPARRAFGAALDADASCGIAAWGIAMTWVGNPLAGSRLSRQTLASGRSAIERAWAAGAATPRERDYIAAIQAFYAPPDAAAMRARHLAYEEAMEGIYRRYPEDREAAAFYALALNAAADPTDQSYARQLRAAPILEELHAEQPNHPGAAHYLIHTYDYPALANRGLAAARRYASIAPAVPHALHMPSHTFTRLGLWEESIASNSASAAASPPGGRVHAWDYMMYAHLQLAQDAAAQGVLDLTTQRPTGASILDAAIPARHAVETRRWADAAALVAQPADLPQGRGPQAEAVVHQARAIGAARIGDVAGAQASTQRLNELQRVLAGRGADSAYWAGQVGIWEQEAAGWLAWAERRNDDAVRLMRAAADAEDATDKDIVWPGPITPAREMLAELLLELGRPAEALVEFDSVQLREPNRFWAVYGAGRAAELAGDSARARASYVQLIGISAQADTDRPALLHARAYLGQR